MKTNVNFYAFSEAFKSIRPDNFTYVGLRALYDYLIDLEESTGEESEFDVIGLCGDYDEYENIGEVLKNYDDIKDLEELKKETMVIEVEGSESLIIQAF